MQTKGRSISYSLFSIQFPPCVSLPSCRGRDRTEGIFSQLILASDKPWNPFLHGRGTVDFVAVTYTEVQQVKPVSMFIHFFHASDYCFKDRLVYLSVNLPGMSGLHKFHWAAPCFARCAAL